MLRLAIVSKDSGDVRKNTLVEFKQQNPAFPVCTVVQTEKEQQVDPKFYDSIYHIQRFKLVMTSDFVAVKSKLLAKLYEKMLPPFWQNVKVNM